MNAFFITHRFVVAAAVVTLILGLISCARISAETPPCCCEVTPAAPLSDQSLYQLDSKWTSDHGRIIRLATLQGHPQVVAMMFISCEFGCQIIVTEMKRIADALPPEICDKVNFTPISFDHERGTPEELLAFRKRVGLPVADCTLLHGEADDVHEMAALLGVNCRKETRGPYAHSNTLTVLSPTGEMVHQQIGLNPSPDETVQQLLTLFRK